MSSLTFTIIQTDLYWEQKALNLQMLEEKINRIQQKTEVVILPEMFSTGFSMKPEQLAETMDGDTIKWMKRISSEKKIILTGSIIITENGNYYNRLVWMLPNGQMGLYDKKHLFAYANEDKHYTPGNKRLIASVKGWKINLLICYDLRFPVWSRQSNKSLEENRLEYDVLIYVANWPEKRSHMWKTLLQARAIENQSFCIGVNRVGNDGNGIKHSGDSMVVNVLGEVLYHKADDQDIFTITLEKEELDKIRDKMPFWKDADQFKILQD
ncbi:amidohydrolase [Segetibacter koreensis]|uniref:amidohydrolase n=1 Tax=Segetibacter koreensis TaxID=398037 RepID=UPI00037D06FA|nr:amidohydrolase [Segetibacter koreensis]